MRIVSTVVLVLALLAAPPLASGAVADQNDPRLDRLFQRLESADGPREARFYASRIWAIWYSHPSGSIEALMRAGRAALQDDDLKGALIAFDDAVRKAPNFAEAWNARATARYMMGNYERALADVRRTLTLEPRHFGALAGRGLCHIKLDNLERAAEAFEASLAIHPHQPGVEGNLRMVRKRLDNLDL